MGSVQPFLEGSFLERSCARRFGSIQSEAVIRVGRIRSHEEVEGPLGCAGRPSARFTPIHDPRRDTIIGIVARRRSRSRLAWRNVTADRS